MMEMEALKSEMDHLNLDDIQDENALNEALLSVLFGSDVSSNAKTLANHPETGVYLNRLSQMGVMGVSGEPDRLMAESALVRSQMDELAFVDFEKFTSGARGVAYVREGLVELQESAESVSEAIPRLSSACRDFLTRVRGIAKSRKVHHKTLWQHANMVELLELSQLMDACVKNFFYDEALEIQNHALRLANLHHDIPVIRMIAEEIKASTMGMQRQLHLLLSGTVNLPSSLRIVGFLRRLGLYSDFELRIVYLQCRSAFLDQRLAIIPTHQTFNFLTKVIDTTRALLSEITTQYRAIFEQDEDSLLIPNPSDTTSTGSMRAEENASVLQCWLFHQIETFIKTLQAHLPLLQDGTSLSNLLSQCMYFGLSMGRLGADFRHLLSPIFEHSILSLVQSQLNDAIEVFSWQLKRYRPILSLSASPHTNSSLNTSQQSLKENGDGKAENVLSEDGAQTSQSISISGGIASASSNPLKPASVSTPNPPLILMDFMPLAHLLNLLIGTLNEIRKCCPHSLAPQLTLAFENAVIEAVDRLAVFRSQMEGDSEQDKATFQALCAAFSDHLLPHFFATYDALWKSSKPLIPETRVRKALSSLMQS
jgi:hypothetical protein